MINNSGDWMILKTPERFWHFPYHVVSPTGRLEEIAMFWWSARRALRKAARRPVSNWWTAPVVYREAPADIAADQAYEDSLWRAER